MKKILTVITFFLSTTYLISNDTDITISNVKIMKRNKPSCDRQGNLYDACQWMLKFKINNNTNNDLISFCSVIKVNKKKYKLCGNKTKKKFHTYLNPERKVSEKALEVHGYTDEFLSKKKKFSEVVDEFLSFIKNRIFIRVSYLECIKVHA